MEQAERLGSGVFATSPLKASQPSDGFTMAFLSHKTRRQLGTAVISIQNPSEAAAELQLLAGLKRSSALQISQTEAFWR